MELFNLTNRDLYLIHQLVSSSKKRVDKILDSGKVIGQSSIHGIPCISIKILDEDEKEDLKTDSAYRQILHIEEVLKPIIDLIESSDEFESIKDLKLEDDEDY